MSVPTPPPDHVRRKRTESSSGRPAYTLTACIRCRERKSKCDASLPRCGLCEKSGQAQCEYWDAAKRMRLPRSHIVRLRNEVEKLESALAQYDLKDTTEPEDEDLVREAAVVEFRSTPEQKFLGPSSGITMTRLVMRLAKQVIGTRSINDVISAEHVREIDARAAQEESRPITKTADYPLVSAYAERKLPHKELCDTLIQLFNVKVQTMYPLFHEESLPKLFDEVMRGTTDPAKNFVVLMIVAISLQKLEMKYAGVADSYYLGALTYFEAVVRAMNLETLQCCILIGHYSLLTPTRTAAWYVVGLGVRLALQLNLGEETTIILDDHGRQDTPYNVDMKRRAFWAIITMDYGLAHSLGRPAAMSTEKACIDVKHFLRLDDEYIKPGGIKPGPVSIRKWIAIHFYNMRMLQLEIRRTLYLHKKPTPVSDADPWFKNMESKLHAWCHATPTSDEGSGLGSIWFKGRYNTMIVFLFRPSPQVPKPSIRAAILCYEASKWNIYMHRDQATQKTVEMTWIWTQALFMAVNTMLWSLSYVEVRDREEVSRDAVETHLGVAMEALRVASERWPGVVTAIELYQVLIQACLQIFNKEGDLYLGPSPYADSDQSIKSGSPSPPMSHPVIPLQGLTHLQMDSRSSSTSQPQFFSNGTDSLGEVHAPASTQMPPTSAPVPSTTSNNVANAYHAHLSGDMPTPNSMVGPSHESDKSFLHPLPADYSQLISWPFTPNTEHANADDSNGVGWSDFPDDLTWDNLGGFGEGIDQARHNELVQDLQTSALDHIEHMVHQEDSFWRANALTTPLGWDD